jgi:hypothetical protein
MKYAGMEVAKVTTINQPVRLAIFLVSMRDSMLTMPRSPHPLCPDAGSSRSLRRARPDRPGTLYNQNAAVRFGR